MSRSLLSFRLGMRGLIAAGCLFLLGACSESTDFPRAPYVPLAELERTYGRLITAGNHPTPDQHGTGDRIGLFLDSGGTVWGLPLRVATAGTVLGCAPPALRNVKTTDTYPIGTIIIGATNEPTGWRGGTGSLEIIFRGSDGTVGWRSIRGAQMSGGPLCWAQEMPGPAQALYYYRIDPAGSN